MLKLKDGVEVDLTGAVDRKTHPKLEFLCVTIRPQARNHAIGITACADDSSGYRNKGEKRFGRPDGFLRALEERNADGVWPIHQLGDEYRIFGGEPDVAAINKMLPKGPVTPDQLNNHLMPYAEKVAEAVMKLSVERRNVVLAITCHNDLIRTLGRMDGRENLDSLKEAAGVEGLVMLYNISSTFISLVSCCLHRHPQIAEAVEESARASEAQRKTTDGI